jgi:hypothetical protein
MPRVKQARETDLMERPMGADLAVAGNNKVTVPVHPFEIATVSVDVDAHPR